MAATIVGAESAFANPLTETDELLLDALRRWKAAVDHYNADPRCGDDPEWIQLLQDADNIVSEIAGIPATGITGLAIKLYFSHEQGLGLDRNFRPAWCCDRQEGIGESTLDDALRLAPAVAAILNPNTKTTITY